jgi:hypothetical protein
MPNSAVVRKGSSSVAKCKRLDAFQSFALLYRNCFAFGRNCSYSKFMTFLVSIHVPAYFHDFMPFCLEQRTFGKTAFAVRLQHKSSTLFPS